MDRRVLPRFALVGVLNTIIDAGVFMLLHDRLGIVAGNAASTSTGMAFSFVMNGRYTFRADRLTLRDLALFVLTNAVTMWVVQPLVIGGLRQVVGTGETATLLAKLAAIAVSVVLNFAAYGWVIWPAARASSR